MNQNYCNVLSLGRRLSYGGNQMGCPSLIEFLLEWEAPLQEDLEVRVLREDLFLLEVHRFLSGL